MSDRRAPPSEDSLALERLSDRLDDLEREAFEGDSARVLSRRGIAAALFRGAVRGLRLMLEGDAERAAQQFEVLSSELRDTTVSLQDEPRR